MGIAQLFGFQQIFLSFLFLLLLQLAITQHAVEVGILGSHFDAFLSQGNGVIKSVEADVE